MSYKHFDLTQEIDQAILNNDRRSIISTLTSICYRDKNFTTGEFDDAVEYVTVVKNFAKLMEPFKDDRPMYRSRVENKDCTLSSNDYADAIAWLKLNFCPERIEDTRMLGQYLFPQKERTSTKVGSGARPTNDRGGTAKPGANSSNNDDLKRGIAIAAVAAVAVGALILFLTR